MIEDVGKRIILAAGDVLAGIQSGHTIRLYQKDCLDSIEHLMVGDELALWLPLRSAFIIHPVVVKKVEDGIEVAINYAFGFAQAVKMTIKGGIVRQAGWPLGSGIKWIKRPTRDVQGFIWYKVEDGLPWLPVDDSVNAKNWGVLFGFRP